MYEELIEPLKECFSGAYITLFFDDVKKQIIENYGCEVVNKIEELQNEFYNLNKNERYNYSLDDPLSSYEDMKKKSHKLFLKKYPNTCSDVLDILSIDFYYNCVMH